MIVSGCYCHYVMTNTISFINPLGGLQTDVQASDWPFQTSLGPFQASAAPSVVSRSLPYTQHLFFLTFFFSLVHHNLFYFFRLWRNWRNHWPILSVYRSDGDKNETPIYAATSKKLPPPQSIVISPGLSAMINHEILRSNQCYQGCYYLSKWMIKTPKFQFYLFYDMGCDT